MTAFTIEESPRAPSNIDRRLGERLKYFRRIKGMSQEKLGESVGLTFQQIQKYEKGVNRIAVARLIEFSAALDFAIGDFLKGIVLASDPDDASGHAEQLLVSAEGAALFRLFSGADPATRRTMVNVVRAVSRHEALEAAE